MTKKDFTSQENIDIQKAEEPEGSNLSPANTNRQTSTGKTYVKNANATGDGAFGRTETSLPEEEDMEDQKEADPPY